MTTNAGHEQMPYKPPATRAALKSKLIKRFADFLDEQLGSTDDDASLYNAVNDDLREQFEERTKNKEPKAEINEYIRSEFFSQIEEGLADNQVEIFADLEELFS